MTLSVAEIACHDFSSSDKLMLDTNIWLFIYGPQKPGDGRVAAYSDALARILSVGCSIYIDVLIVSEFINTYARLRWNLLSPRPAKFKEFRKSAVFRSVARDIAADTKRILQHCVRLKGGLGSISLDSLIDEYAMGDLDFNDQVLTALCSSKGLTMITDDADFRNRGIPIITANKRLLTG
jgi:predicted nucleic acid-binding protein